jgi:phosphatidate phosphatase APP1
MRNDFRGANVQQSAIGKNASVVNNSYAIPAQSELDRLHDLLEQLRAQLPQAEAEPERRERLSGLLDRVEEAIEPDEVDLEKAHSRWERVRAMLAPAGQLAETAGKITDLVQSLLPG